MMIRNMLSRQMSFCSVVDCIVLLFPLQGELDRERFSTDIKRTVETDTGYKAELRIFVSKGETFLV